MSSGSDVEANLLKALQEWRTEHLTMSESNHDAADTSYAEYQNTSPISAIQQVGGGSIVADPESHPPACPSPPPCDAAATDIPTVPNSPREPEATQASDPPAVFYIHSTPASLSSAFDTVHRRCTLQSTRELDWLGRNIRLVEQRAATSLFLAYQSRIGEIRDGFLERLGNDAPEDTPLTMIVTLSHPVVSSYQHRGEIITDLTIVIPSVSFGEDGDETPTLSATNRLTARVASWRPGEWTCARVATAGLESF